jgi:hypothetical protein
LRGYYFDRCVVVVVGKWLFIVPAILIPDIGFASSGLSRAAARRLLGHVIEKKEIHVRAHCISILSLYIVNEKEKL